MVGVLAEAAGLTDGAGFRWDVRAAHDDGGGALSTCGTRHMFARVGTLRNRIARRPRSGRASSTVGRRNSAATWRSLSMLYIGVATTLNAAWVVVVRPCLDGVCILGLNDES